jgi:hypothetical protein
MAYDRLLLKQDGRCAICKRLPYTKKGLVVDHCHETGIIRGILCSRCSSALGLLDDSPLPLEWALEYLAWYRYLMSALQVVLGGALVFASGILKGSA